MLVSWATILASWSVWACRCEARRGPHHPRGEAPSDHHHHHRPLAGEKLTQDLNLIHDTKHLGEELGILVSKKVSDMTDDELDFYYFALHDYDMNKLLDGLEILKAVMHIADHDVMLADDGEKQEPKNCTKSGRDLPFDVEKTAEMVDRLLAEDDTNNDGFLSYSEYKSSMKYELAMKRRASTVSTVEV